MNFTDQIEVRSTRYRLRSIAQYAGPRDLLGSSTGGHYTAYVRSEAGG